MAYNEVEEILIVSDISEGFSSNDEGCDGGELLIEPIRGVRNGGLPPFVNKLYNMVNNKDTDSIISWVPNLNLGQRENQVSGGATSFAIWNHDEFINNVLPLMSKSKNFDSFITQLNDYGFKKMSWDHSEYANEWFQEGKPHLLKNITRRRKQTISESEKLKHEIKRLESVSKELDNEVNTFKQYVENTMSNQKKIIQAMAKVIKSTIDHHHHVRRMDLAGAGKENQQASVLGESSFVPSCEAQAEEKFALE